MEGQHGTSSRGAASSGDAAPARGAFRCALILRITASKVRGREPAGEGVLLRGVVRAEQPQPRAPRSWVTPWPKASPRGTSPEPALAEHRQQAVHADPPQHEDRPQARGEEPPLPLQVVAAGEDLVAGRLVGGRGAAGDGRDVARRASAQAVLRARWTPAWLAKPGAVERREQEVAGAVAGEDPAGAVGPVGRRGEADDQEPGLAGRRSRGPGGPSSRRPGSASPSRGRPGGTTPAGAGTARRRPRRG